MSKIIKFGSDTKQRKDWFTGISFSHPAKMILPLQLWIIDNFIKEGETILDPMAGSGTILVACSMGRNVITVELEDKFVQMQKDNWEKVKMRGPQLGYQMGTATMLQGDARNLKGLLVDNCVFSPPYAEAQEGAAIPKRGYQGPKHSPTDLVGKRSYMPEQAGQSEGQISSLPYGSIDTVISSPPFFDNKSDWDRKSHAALEGEAVTYSDEVGMGVRENIGNIHYYDQGEPLSHKYSRAKPEAETYLSAMLLVYQNCYSVLKDGGLMVLVTKNFIRNKKQVRLDLDTIKLCEQAGFTFQDRWYRELRSQSFWRTIYYQKFPQVEAIKFEDILVFSKQPLMPE